MSQNFLPGQIIKHYGVYRCSCGNHEFFGVSGRVFCSTRKKAQLIAWLDNTTVAAARGTDDVAVYKWWARLVDRTMNATQLALLNQVPPGIDRTNCGDDGSDAIKRADPAKDVYVVRYTKYQSPSALAAGYSSAEAPSRVAMDSPPQGDPTAPHPPIRGFRCLRASVASHGRAGHRAPARAAPDSADGPRPAVRG